MSRPDRHAAGEISPKPHVILSSRTLLSSPWTPLLRGEQSALSHPSSKGIIAKQFLGQQVVSFGQRMTRVRVHWAWKDGWEDCDGSSAAQPCADGGAQLLIVR